MESYIVGNDSLKNPKTYTFGKPGKEYNVIINNRKVLEAINNRDNTLLMESLKSALIPEKGSSVGLALTLTFYEKISLPWVRENETISTRNGTTGRLTI